MSNLLPWVVGGGLIAAGLLAVSRATARTPAPTTPLDTAHGKAPVWWTDADYAAFVAMTSRLGMNPADLGLVFQSESGLNPTAANRNATGYPVAVGIPQFTAASNGATGLSEDQRVHLIEQPVSVQIPLIERFFNALAWTKQRKGYPHAGIIYANLYVPARLSRGSALDTVLVTEGVDGAMYSSNKILDSNKDGKVTIGDLVEHLRGVSKSPNYLGFLDKLRQVTENATLSPNLPR